MMDFIEILKILEIPVNDPLHIASLVKIWQFRGFLFQGYSHKDIIKNLSKT